MNKYLTKLAGLSTWLPVRTAVSASLLFFSFAVFAETIEIKLPSGIVAYAEFKPGATKEIAVLSLHGFLQTHHSQPMSALANNLAAEGYTILSPTISLGINRRKQSLACEAAHMHTMDNEVEEVAFWINWLSNKGYKKIIPVGFSSTGNIALLLYNTQGSHPSISKMILASINPVYSSKTEYLKHHTAAKLKPEMQSKKIARYSVGYCKNNFSATLNTYLSYSTFIDDKILDLIGKVNIPLEIILGSADNILPDSWPARIIAKNPQARITIVNKANHFFDGITELDLADNVEAILKTSTSH